MKKYLIKLKGIQYEVEVEEVLSNGGDNGTSVPAQAFSAPVEATAPVTPVAAVAAPSAPSATPAVPAITSAPAGSVGSEKIVSPMPGTILKVSVSAGESVKKGQILVVLEAMKMENEIVAANDGVVATVNVTRGASVNTGDLLVSLN